MVRAENIGRVKGCNENYEKELAKDKCGEGRTVPVAQMESETINRTSVGIDDIFSNTFGCKHLGQSGYFFIQGRRVGATEE